MTRTRGSATVLLLVAAATLALIVSSGAVVLDGPTDPITDEVALQPGDNPYTYLDEDGELVVDVTEDNRNLDAGGVNPDAFVAEDTLFYVVYDANATAEVWIEHDSKAVTFVARGEPIESGEDPLLLTPEDEAVPVGVEVDTRIVDAVPGDRVLDEISVHARPAEPEAITQDDGGAGTDGDDGGDGDGGDDESGDEDGDSSGPTVTVESPEPTARQVEVYSVAVNDETEVDLSGLHVGGPSVRLDGLSFVREEPGDVEFSVEGSADAPAGVDPVDRAGVDPLGYYAVAFAEPDQPIESATAEVVVERDRLEEAGVDPANLAAYHETGDGDDWNATDLRVTGETEGTVRLAIESDGFSAFALGVRRPALDPVDAEIASESVAPGESVRLDVTLSNVGPAPAEGARVSVRAVDATDDDAADADDPDPADAERLSVDAEPNGTVTRTLTVELDDPGEYDLVVDGDRVTDPEAVASLAVREPEPEPTDPDSGDGEGAGSGTDAEPGSGTDSGSVPTPGTGPDTGDEPGDGDTEESVSGDGAGDDAETPVESVEPNGFEPEDFAGLAVLVTIVLATLFLVRRAPR
ncbi:MULTISPECIES: DUF1102 domain-containing protein [Haloferacaceae]|uniref:DUF1102 domain-containing protein n=1 Tax=Halorubrum glutamatedens TaxID=2707018 RepID=A0ABD5QPL6_9EURY|nr:DUF1102 domain-containing protein [Halobellus captivus]